MEIEVTARSDGVPDKARDYARDKLAKLSRVFDRVGRVSVALERGKGGSKAHAVAHLDSGSTVVAETTHEELRGAIDLLAEKLQRQVRREKERLIGRNRKASNSAVEPSVPDTELPAAENDPTYEDVIQDTLEED